MLFFSDDLTGEPDDVDRIARLGGLKPPTAGGESRKFFVPASPVELPLMMGSCSELGGSVFICATLRRLFVKRGDMKVIGRPLPGVAAPASCRRAFKSSSMLTSRSAVCRALMTGTLLPSDSFLAEPLFNLGVGSLGLANTSLKSMLMGVSGAPPPSPPPTPFLFFPEFFDASGLMQIILL